MEKDLLLHHNGNEHNCICIKDDTMITRDGPYVNVSHRVGDKCKCMEYCNKAGEILGYYIMYDTYRIRLFEFEEYYKIID